MPRPPRLLPQRGVDGAPPLLYHLLQQAKNARCEMVSMRAQSAADAAQCPASRKPPTSHPSSHSHPCDTATRPHSTSTAHPTSLADSMTIWRGCQEQGFCCPRRKVYTHRRYICDAQCGGGQAAGRGCWAHTASTAGHQPAATLASTAPHLLPTHSELPLRQTCAFATWPALPQGSHATPSRTFVGRVTHTTPRRGGSTSAARISSNGTAHSWQDGTGHSFECHHQEQPAQLSTQSAHAHAKC